MRWHWGPSHSIMGTPFVAINSIWICDISGLASIFCYIAHLAAPLSPLSPLFTIGTNSSFPCFRGKNNHRARGMFPLWGGFNCRQVLGPVGCTTVAWCPIALGHPANQLRYCTQREGGEIDPTVLEPLGAEKLRRAFFGHFSRVKGLSWYGGMVVVCICYLMFLGHIELKYQKKAGRKHTHTLMTHKLWVLVLCEVSGATNEWLIGTLITMILYAKNCIPGVFSGPTRCERLVFQS